MLLHAWNVICQWCSRYWWGTIGLRKVEFVVFALVFPWACLLWSHHSEKRVGTIQLQSGAIQHSGSSIAVAKTLGRWQDESVPIVLVWFQVHKEEVVLDSVSCIVITIYIHILQNRWSLAEQSPIIGRWAPIWPCVLQSTYGNYFHGWIIPEQAFGEKGSDSEILQSCCVFVICWVW